MTQITLREFQKQQLRRQHALFGIKQLKIGGSFSHLPRSKRSELPMRCCNTLNMHVQIDILPSSPTVRLDYTWNTNREYNIILSKLNMLCWFTETNCVNQLKKISKLHSSLLHKSCLMWIIWDNPSFASGSILADTAPSTHAIRWSTNGYLSLSTSWSKKSSELAIRSWWRKCALLCSVLLHWKNRCQGDKQGPRSPNPGPSTKAQP